MTSERDIYVYLVTEKDFKTPFTGTQTLRIAAVQGEKAGWEASFSFEEVKAGTYGIRCFQDLNRNGLLDRGIGGPGEPWGMSWQQGKPRKWPRFSHIVFDVYGDVTEMNIILH